MMAISAACSTIDDTQSNNDEKQCRPINVKTFHAAYNHRNIDTSFMEINESMKRNRLVIIILAAFLMCLISDRYAEYVMTPAAPAPAPAPADIRIHTWYSLFTLIKSHSSLFLSGERGFL